MAPKFISEKEFQDRKREKRLVHLTNELIRGYIQTLKVKTRAQLDYTDFVVRSFLDFIFFEERKEIAELHPEHARFFLTDYVPRRLDIGKENAREIPGILVSFIRHLAETGFIKNIDPVLAELKAQEKPFARIAASLKKEPAVRPVKSKEKITAKPAYPDVGRNDPCPCGSGKKYKKCHGLNA